VGRAVTAARMHFRKAGPCVAEYVADRLQPRVQDGGRVGVHHHDVLEAVDSKARHAVGVRMKEAEGSQVGARAKRVAEGDGLSDTTRPGD